MKNYILKSFVASFLLLMSCSQYNKVVKSDNYQAKYDLANELYEKKQFMRSITLYEQVYQRSPKTGEGELAYYRIGKSYYAEKDYYMAGYYLGAFYQRFPGSPKAEECLFLSAMCSVANSPKTDLDQNETELAINDLQQFINKYPSSSLVDSCNHVMDRLRFKLETKEFETVELYDRTENFRAAMTTASTFLDDYPRSIYREEVHYILFGNAFYVAKNSVIAKKKERIEQAIERYRNFVAEFPSSKYIKEITSKKEELENLLK
jgi:outer membrane protein assembly factor BamD